MCCPVNYGPGMLPPPQQTNRVFCGLLINSNLLFICHHFYSCNFQSSCRFRCNFVLTVVLSSGVYSTVRKRTCSSELWVVQPCVWCSFFVLVTVGASEWEWSKVRGSVWWTWRPLTPPCHQQWKSYWSWETRVWSVLKGILNVFSQSSSNVSSSCHFVRP